MFGRTNVDDIGMVNKGWERAVFDGVDRFRHKKITYPEEAEDVRRALEATKGQHNLAYMGVKDGYIVIAYESDLERAWPAFNKAVSGMTDAARTTSRATNTATDGTRMFGRTNVDDIGMVNKGWERAVFDGVDRFRHKKITYPEEAEDVRRALEATKGQHNLAYMGVKDGYIVIAYESDLERAWPAFNKAVSGMTDAARTTSRATNTATDTARTTDAASDASRATNNTTDVTRVTNTTSDVAQTTNATTDATSTVNNTTDASRVTATTSDAVRTTSYTLDELAAADANTILRNVENLSESDIRALTKKLTPAKRAEIAQLKMGMKPGNMTVQQFADSDDLLFIRGEFSTFDPELSRLRRAAEANKDAMADLQKYAANAVDVELLKSNAAFYQENLLRILASDESLLNSYRNFDNLSSTQKQRFLFNLLNKHGSDLGVTDNVNIEFVSSFPDNTTGVARYTHINGKPTIQISESTIKQANGKTSMDKLMEAATHEFGHFVDDVSTKGVIGSQLTDAGRFFPKKADDIQGHLLYRNSPKEQSSFVIGSTVGNRFSDMLQQTLDTGKVPTTTFSKIDDFKMQHALAGQDIDITLVDNVDDAYYFIKPKKPENISGLSDYFKQKGLRVETTSDGVRIFENINPITDATRATTNAVTDGARTTDTATDAGRVASIGVANNAQDLSQKQVLNRAVDINNRTYGTSYEDDSWGDTLEMYKSSGLARLAENYDSLSKPITNIRGYDVFLEDIPGANGKIGQISGRPIVVVNVNGKKIPFYISTGSAGNGVNKLTVPSGKWEAIFGIEKRTDGAGNFVGSGWFNKGNLSQIENHYGSRELKQIANALDNIIGDVRDTKLVNTSATRAANGGIGDTAISTLLPNIENSDALDLINESMTNGAQAYNGSTTNFLANVMDIQNFLSNL